MVTLDNYGSEKQVEYGGETYLVRDNGAVYRNRKPGRLKRVLDEHWTFGRPNKADRYMCLGPVKVHRIVAFAFLGHPPSERHVVDHIDRDRSNNRIENLRWVHVLDNLIRHPGFRKRISEAYGSLENFAADPTRMINEVDPSINWLKTISKEEAQKSIEQLTKWTQSDQFVTPGVLGNRVHGNLPPPPPARPPIPAPEKQSLTPLAVQRNWNTPTEFPCCPKEVGQNSLVEYANNLHPDAVFAKDRYKESLVVMAEPGDALLSILVRSTEPHAVKPWAVAKVTIENGKFVHEGMGTYFELDGAKKTFYGLLGIPFSAESIDDFC